MLFLDCCYLQFRVLDKIFLFSQMFGFFPNLVRLKLCLFVCLFDCLFDCLFTCLLVCFLVYLFTCLLVCLFIWTLHI